MLASRVDERNPPQLHTNCNLTPRLRRVITQEQTTKPFVAKWDNLGLLGATAICDDANGTNGLERFLFRLQSDVVGGATNPSPRGSGGSLASVAMRREIEIENW